MVAEALPVKVQRLIINCMIGVLGLEKHSDVQINDQRLKLNEFHTQGRGFANIYSKSGCFDIMQLHTALYVHCDAISGAPPSRKTEMFVKQNGEKGPRFAKRREEEETS